MKMLKSFVVCAVLLTASKSFSYYGMGPKTDLGDVSAAGQYLSSNVAGAGHETRTGFQVGLNVSIINTLLDELEIWMVRNDYSLRIGDLEGVAFSQDYSPRFSALESVLGVQAVLAIGDNLEIGAKYYVDHRNYMPDFKYSAGTRVNTLVPAGFIRLKSLYFEGAYGTGLQDGNDRTLQVLIGRYYVGRTTFLGFRYDEAEINYSAGATTSFQSMSVQIGTGL